MESEKQKILSEIKNLQIRYEKICLLESYKKKVQELEDELSLEDTSILSDSDVDQSEEEEREEESEDEDVKPVSNVREEFTADYRAKKYNEQRKKYGRIFKD